DNPLEPLGVQYADFTLWQRQWLDEGALGREMDYWKRQLAGIPERLEMPADRPRSSIQTFDAQICSRRFDPDPLAELMRLGQEHQASLFMTPLGGFAVLMNRYIGQDDIVVGSPIANRQERQLEELIGFFMNSLVLRVRVKGESSFSELVSEVRQTTLDAYQHQEIPFERLVEELGVERSLNTTPVFQVMFAMQNAPIKAQQLEGLTIEPLGSEKLQVRYDLEVHAFEENGELWVHWLYNRDLFDAWRIEQMAAHYERLMTAAVAAPQEPLSGLEMLSAEESRRLLVELNQTGRPIPDQMPAELFQQQAKQTPKAVAIRVQQERLTYQELNLRANRLADHLGKLGVGPETLVGVYLERSTEMVVALLGILKAGGASLPLDPAYPQERLAFMLEDSGVKVLLTQQRLLGQLPAHQARTVCLDADWERISRERAANPVSKARMENLAYVIY